MTKKSTIVLYFGGQYSVNEEQYHENGTSSIFVLITMTLGLTFGSVYSQSPSNSSGASN
jgi:hypothetical protein